MVRVDKQTIIADYFVIATGTSTTHIKSLADELEFRLGEEGYSPSRIDGVNNDSWVLMDYGSVLIHIFKPESREFYKLDKLWGEGIIKDIRSIAKPEAEN
ncbi:MAG: ribosome silencing factor [Eubacteriales bacterium]